MAIETEGPDEVLARLGNGAELKVWSLLATAFGDAAVAPGACLTGPILSDLLEPAGVRPEAIRVALHRLRKDGWITTRRRGRIGLYALTEAARAETLAVADRIYAPEVRAPMPWYLVLTPTGSPPPEKALLLGPDRFLCRAPAAPPALSAPWQDAVPGWVSDRILPAGLEQEFDRLADALDRPVAIPGNTVHAATLRILILHHWRRLVLRTPALAEDLLALNWSGGRCRGLVSQWLSALPRPSADSFTG